MRHWKLILTLIAVFSCGTGIGVMLALKGVELRIEQRMNPANWTPRTMAWLTEELALTHEQQQNIQPVVAEMTLALKELQNDADTERKAIYGKMFMEITLELSSEQQSQLKNTLSEFTAAKHSN